MSYTQESYWRIPFLFFDNKNIKSVTPGFVEGPAMFKEKDCVTLTTPYRAKGNEASIVFVINSQKAISDITYRARNAL